MQRAEPSRSEMTQFIQEVKLMRRLHHRNIVQVRYRWRWQSNPLVVVASSIKDVASIESVGQGHNGRNVNI